MEKKKDRVFTLSGLHTEWKRVRWTHLKTDKDHGDGAIKLTGEVVLFATVFALMFVAYDAVLALLLKM